MFFVRLAPQGFGRMTMSTTQQWQKECRYLEVNMNAQSVVRFSGANRTRWIFERSIPPNKARENNRFNQSREVSEVTVG